ncbi:hypothetical protein [Terrihabitans rhizophilus]|uniref:Uncharacterized protein n=1 Tax=Terrihabitans rhizophilus TaxID=3092662 RepID=A0ABU4RNE9_9HYPH|nr:hypothetical protein [Terrihabitans sp. PJ23]MDX6806348.1 hypothetical protein [Terrihabitans sp. PJ23]
MSAVRDAIAAHLALIEHDETLFNDDDDMIACPAEVEASERACLASFNNLMAAPCLTLEDVRAKADYLLHGTIGERKPVLDDLTGPEGSDVNDPAGPLVAFLKSLAGDGAFDGAPTAEEEWITVHDEGSAFDFDKIQITTRERLSKNLVPIAYVEIGFSEAMNAEQRGCADLIVRSVNANLSQVRS